MITIRVRQHGSYVIEGDGDVRIVDWEDREYAVERRPIALCRCGHSKTRPFCDGSHRQQGIAPMEPAPGAPVPQD